MAFSRPSMYACPVEKGGRAFRSLRGGHPRKTKLHVPPFPLRLGSKNLRLTRNRAQPSSDAHPPPLPCSEIQFLKKRLLFSVRSKGAGQAKDHLSKLLTPPPRPTRHQQE